VTERPHNARMVDRGYGNGGGYHARRPLSDLRGDDVPNLNPSYRGNHRASGQHHLDHQTAAQQRSSRVGRHHADPYDDYLNR
jgi:hypothetical protein